jgi:hypothetical protein
MTEAVLSLYPAIIVLALPAFVVYTTKILLPSLFSRTVFDKHLLGVGGWCYLAAHLIETPKYGLIRLFDQFGWLLNYYPLIALAKLLLLSGAVFTCAGLLQATYGRSYLRRVWAVAIAVWLS